jgi:multidrug transporter EmrE-like cation transporter
MEKALPYLLLIGVVCANIAANVLIKLGANSVALSSGLMALVNPRVVAGIACFGVGVVLYAAALRSVPLNVAQSVAILQFAGVVLVSAILLHEVISPMRMVGIGLIGVGVIVVIFSAWNPNNVQ